MRTTVTASPTPADYHATPRCTHCGENKMFCDEQVAKYGDAGKCCSVCEHTVIVTDSASLTQEPKA